MENRALPFASRTYFSSSLTHKPQTPSLRKKVRLSLSLTFFSICDRNFFARMLDQLCLANFALYLLRFIFCRLIWEFLEKSKLNSVLIRRNFIPKKAWLSFWFEDILNLEKLGFPGEFFDIFALGLIFRFSLLCSILLRF